MNVRRRSVFAGSVVLLGTLIGCTQQKTVQGMSFSREEIYESIDDLRGASDLVVVVKVPDDPERIDRPIEGDGDGLGDTEMTLPVLEASTSGTRLDGSEVTLTEVTVIFLGNEAIEGSPSNLIKSGATYALYLVRSGLSGDDAEKYFVTGVDAGIFEQTGDDFTSKGEGEDDLPQSITESEAIAGS